MIRKYFLGIIVLLTVACTDQSVDAGAGDTGPRDAGTRLGNIYIAPAPSSAEMITHVEGGAESLYFRASEGDVICDSISVITSDRETLIVYSGRIAEEDAVRTPLPDEAGGFTRIRFECSTDDPLRAKLDIAVETST